MNMSIWLENTASLIYRREGGTRFHKVLKTWCDISVVHAKASSYCSIQMVNYVTPQ